MNKLSLLIKLLHTYNTSTLSISRCCVSGGKRRIQNSIRISQGVWTQSKILSSRQFNYNCTTSTHAFWLTCPFFFNIMLSECLSPIPRMYVATQQPAHEYVKFSTALSRDPDSWFCSLSHWNKIFLSNAPLAPFFFWILAMVELFSTTSIIPTWSPVDRQPYGFILCEHVL